MHWSDPSILGEVFESRLTLSRSECATLKKAHAVLGRIRSEIEANYGGIDDAVEVPIASDWIYAESHFGEAIEGLHDNSIVLEPREKKTQERS